MTSRAIGHGLQGWSPRALTEAAICRAGRALAGDALDGLAVVEEYTGHDNTTIAYGVDWCHRDELTVPLLASCSFYEQRLNLWSPSTSTGDAHEGGAC